MERGGKLVTNPTLIERGDHVTIGEGKVHWFVKSVIHFNEPGAHDLYYILESGQSGRMRTEFPPNVKLYRKGRTADLLVAQGR